MPHESVTIKAPAPLPQIGNYELQHLLGEGGAGRVYKAVQISTGKVVALKILLQNINSDTNVNLHLLKRFERETRLCAQLHHPHIVQLLDKGQTENEQLFAVFEFVPGETLKDLLIRKGALSAPESGELMSQVLDALACAHAKGIAHRDLKPQNIMIDTTGKRMHAKVLDFGIAAFITERGDYRNITLAQETMCSPSYSAPEQLRGEPPSVKIDLYAWGLLLIECLTGRPAIQGSTLAEIFHKQLSTMEVPIPAALVNHPLAAFLRKVLRKNPVERAESATALYDEFCRINLGNIVGDLSTPNLNLTPQEQDRGSITQPSVQGWFAPECQRQQMTVLSCTLNVSALPSIASGNHPKDHKDQKDYDIALETQEALQNDQMNLCLDIATRHGGHAAGALGNSMMFYFGYPAIADDDARRCARTALELIGKVNNRSALLAAQGFKLAIRMGIHTGMIRVMPGYLPTGLTPNTALQLERMAAAGTVLVSETSRRLLDQYVEFDDAEHAIESDSGEMLPYFTMLGEYKAEAVFLMRCGNLADPLVGRKQEMKMLSESWAQICKEQAPESQPEQPAAPSGAKSPGLGKAILLQGEAGIGKSWLAYECCIMARKQGGTTKELRCMREYQNNALHPILEVLKSHYQLHESSSPQEAVTRLQTALAQTGSNIEWVLPILCSWLGLPIPDAFPPLQFSPDRQKKILFTAMQGLILKMGHAQPLLLLIEDVHWLDSVSLEFLLQMAQIIPKYPVLMLMTARPQFYPRWQNAHPSALLTRIQVGRLSDQDAGQLVCKIIHGKKIDPASLRRLCERSDGIPLFVEELTRMLFEHKMLVERNGIYFLDEHFDLGDIPVTLRELLSARLSHLGSARDTAQLASAIGREFDYRLLSQIALVDEGTLQADLDQLIAADLVFRQRRVHGDSYIFRHALLRDAAYNAMPRHIREQAHERIAHQLEASLGSSNEAPLAQLAGHFALAAKPLHALEYGNLATHNFLARALHDDAIKMVRLMQGWLQKLPAEQQQVREIDINLMLINALMSKYGWTDTRVRDSAEHGLLLAKYSTNIQHTVPTLWVLAFYHHVASHRKTVRTLTTQLFDITNTCDDTGLQLASQMMHGAASLIDGEMPAAVTALQQVLAQYDDKKHAHHGYLLGLDSRIWALACLSNAEWFMQPDTASASAFAHAQQAVAHARALNHLPSLGIALFHLSVLHQFADQRREVIEITQEMLALAQKYDLPVIEAFAEILQGWAQGELTRIDRVLARLKHNGCLLRHSFFASLCAEVEARNNHYQAALIRIDNALQLCAQLGDQWYKPMLLIRRASYRIRYRSSFGNDTGNHTGNPGSANPAQEDDFDNIPVPVAPPLICADLQQAATLAQANGMQRCVHIANSLLATLVSPPPPGQM